MATGQQLDVGRVGSSHTSSFLCQKCCQPLKLDTSFYAVDQRLFNELTGILWAATESASGASYGWSVNSWGQAYKPARPGWGT